MRRRNLFLPQLVRGRLAVQTQQSPAPCGVGSHIRMVVDPLAGSRAQCNLIMKYRLSLFLKLIREVSD